MSRVAVVTGGTRGIGATTAVALKDQGNEVAAVYGSNDERAEAFANETGIARPPGKWCRLGARAPPAADRLEVRFRRVPSPVPRRLQEPKTADSTDSRQGVRMLVSFT